MLSLFLRNTQDGPYRKTTFEYMIFVFIYLKNVLFTGESGKGI